LRDVQFGEAESSVRIFLSRRVASTRNPSAHHERPECCHSRKQQESKAKAGANRLRINVSGTNRYERDAKKETYYGVHLKKQDGRVCD
jgi:hypothetical protein